MFLIWPTMCKIL